jgi:hypothetical protein
MHLQIQKYQPKSTQMEETNSQQIVCPVIQTTQHAHQNLSVQTKPKSKSSTRKTIQKFLASFINDSTLNWETFLPALSPSYNTSYHSIIATTPQELLFD